MFTSPLFAFKNGTIYDCLFILNSLLKDFPTSEEVWNLVARRAIDEAKHQVKKGTAVITGLLFSSQIINANTNNRKEFFGPIISPLLRFYH